MKDARGLDVTADNAAADDFSARLLRLDPGVEAILDAVKRWPQTPILQLSAAAFWLYGQTGDAIANAATQLAACATLAMNPRERALHRALSLWHANDKPACGRGHGGHHHRMAARSPDRQICRVPLLRARPAAYGPALSRAHDAACAGERGRSGFSRHDGVRP